MEKDEELTLEELRKIGDQMEDLADYKNFLNLPKDERHKLGRQILEGIGKKEFLTIAEIDEISRFLGPESWEKFLKMSVEKRVQVGSEILEKINKGSDDGKQ